ncbi:MAG: valine--tRNA ligase, partial [Candidatus Omnitrophica bacterium]|nr:valine--tRNA ligase [Candidatus Omnitrophota bacterium]
WQRLRFTMDEDYSKAVKEVFVELWNAGLIYQSDYIINWCPRCQTALADEEAPHHDVEGKLYYIRYPLKTKDQRPKTKNYIVVATTRPETMLGDTAVAVNPKDKRFKNLIGETVILPLMNREIKIIADELVDPKFGTGLVKVTPAHDPNDYEMGLRHKLQFINILHPNGVLNENAGEYAGMDRFEAREAILEDLSERKLIEKIDGHAHAVGHCYRCHTVIEPYLSKQWFVKMKPLAKEAIEAVKKGKIKFHPKRWTKVYLNWMENIRDWCISRQIWWGHRIPVWYCQDCKNIIASVDTPKTCSKCNSQNLKQDEDVLDTWFSSWLWPFATFYWPDVQKTENREQRTEKNLPSDICQPPSDLDYFYPTSVLVTAQEIIFFWVARMIMAGLYFMKDIPFRDVYIHGTVRDIEGKKMSKSLGNVINPLDIIKEYGCDALRFSLVSLTSTGQDVFLSKEKFEKGRNFANKIWNASRFILLNLKEENTRQDLCVVLEKENLNLADRWILSNFYQMLTDLDKALASYRFNESVNLIYEFFWRKFCDWYLEIAKLNINDKNTQIVLYKILEKSLRILHPFMPFITEEVWQKLPGTKESISISPWPHIQKQIIDKKVNGEMQILIDIVVSIRNIRSNVKIPVNEFINIQIQTSNKNKAALIDENKDIIKTLAQVKEIMFIKDKKEKSKGLSSVISKDLSLNIPLEGLVDAQKERERLKTQIKELEASAKDKQARLKNKAFLEKAPEEVVAAEKERVKEIKERVDKFKEIIRAFN